MGLAIQVVFGSLAIGAVYFLVGYGFVLSWRVAKLFNLGQSASGICGAFLCLWLARCGIPLYVDIICGVALGGVLGVITLRMILDPLRRSKVHAWLIGGLGVEIILTEFLEYYWKGGYRFPSLLGLGGQKVITVLGAGITHDKLLLIIAAFFIFYILQTISDHTMWGKAMKATAHDESAAALMGINTSLVVTTVFGLSSALCAIGVMLHAPFTSLSASMGFGLLIKGFVVAIVGGLDSRRGVMIAALGVGFLEALGALIAPAGYRDVFTFGVMLLVLISKPQGLFGKLELREV
jgi:branched-chain amino acid transport system permease protein